MRNLPASLQSKLSQQMQTVHNDADPRMEVIVARARTEVVDYTYWTVETIRETSGLGDVSVAPRRFRAYGSPNRIYEIHVHNGEVKTAIREYPDRLKDGWQDQFSLGTGSSVGIAFDGRWERYRKLWRLITDEKPWLFWVDGNNVLWRQHWDDVATKTQLDTGVARVRAIRAWKNVNLPDKDQGIVVGYIKTDGTVWYRNYCQQADYSYVWESPKQLTQFTATAVSLNMFITNDYRMGFIIEASNGQVHWLITPRNWGGMALERENIAVNAKATVDFIPVTYHHVMHDERLEVSATADVAMLFGRTDNTIIEMENLPIIKSDESEDWGFLVRVKLNYFAVNIPTVALVDTMTNAPIPVAYVEEIAGSGGFQFYVYVNDEVAEFGFNDVEGTVQVIVSGVVNEAGYTYDTMIGEFMPVNLVPPDLPLPEVEAIWNE
jgi:hypothetical protein